MNLHEPGSNLNPSVLYFHDVPKSHSLESGRIELISNKTSDINGRQAPLPWQSRWFVATPDENLRHPIVLMCLNDDSKTVGVSAQT